MRCEPRIVRPAQSSRDPMLGRQAVANSFPRYSLSHVSLIPPSPRFLRLFSVHAPFSMKSALTLFLPPTSGQTTPAGAPVSPTSKLDSQRTPARQLRASSD